MSLKPEIGSELGTDSRHVATSARLSSSARAFATILLESGSVQLNTKRLYTWTSGRQFPIYCDNRRLLSYVGHRADIKRMLVDSVSEHFAAPIDAIAAVATAGLPYGTLVADALELPFAYVRSASKTHGLKRQIEGDLEPKRRLVLIEDHISTGGSALRAAQALQAAGHTVVGVLGLFSYGLPSQKVNFEKANVPLHVLSSYQELLKVAQEEGKYFDPSELDYLVHVFDGE